MLPGMRRVSLKQFKTTNLSSIGREYYYQKQSTQNLASIRDYSQKQSTVHTSDKEEFSSQRFWLAAKKNVLQAALEKEKTSLKGPNIQVDDVVPKFKTNDDIMLEKEWGCCIEDKYLSANENNQNTLDANELKLGTLREDL